MSYGFLDFISALVLIVPLFYHNTFTKKSGSVRTEHRKDNYFFMLFFIGLFALADMTKMVGSTTKKAAKKMELHPHSHIKIRKHERTTFLLSVNVGKYTWICVLKGRLAHPKP